MFRSQRPHAYDIDALCTAQNKARCSESEAESAFESDRGVLTLVVELMKQTKEEESLSDVCTSTSTANLLSFHRLQGCAMRKAGRTTHTTTVEAAVTGQGVATDAIPTVDTDRRPDS